MKRSVLVFCAAVLALAAMAPRAEAAKGVKKVAAANATVRGTVIDVNRKGATGTILIKTAVGRSKSARAQGDQKMFNVDQHTRFMVTRGAQPTPATFTSVHNGEHVTVVATGADAQEVTVALASHVRSPVRNYNAGVHRHRHYSRNYARNHHRHHRGMNVAAARTHVSTKKVAHHAKAKPKPKAKPVKVIKKKKK